MTNDLVKRLRGNAVHSYLGRSVIEEAADRIEQLTAEREALEQDNHRWKMECENFWRDREKDLTAERDRLREALEQFLIEYDEVDLADAEPSSLTAAVLSARAALKEETL